MLKPTGSVVLCLNYTINDDDKTVRLEHPSLSGVLGFQFSTLDLAEIQLQALRLDKTKNVIEEITDDTQELVGLVKELRGAISELKK